MAKDFKPNVLVDFDGVLHSYTSGFQGGTTIPDPPVNGAIQWLLILVRSDKVKVCIYSSRSRVPGGIAAMMTWLWQNGVDHAALAKIDFPETKPPAWLTIDDRAIQFNGSFEELTPEDILAFKPWWAKKTDDD